MPNYVKAGNSYVPYAEVVEYLASRNASFDNVLSYLNARGIAINDVPQIQADIAAWRAKVYGNGKPFFEYTPTVSGNKTPVLSDSNTATPTRGNVSRPVQVTKDVTTGKAKFAKIASKINTSRGLMLVADVGTAACLASVGIQAGRFIDQTLYNANPGFWDSIGASSLNPQTWNNITKGINAPGMQSTVDAFNFLFDLDPDTGEAQAYIDEQAFHYVMAALAQSGVLDAPVRDTTITDTSGLEFAYYTMPIPNVNGGFVIVGTYNSRQRAVTYTVTSGSAYVTCYLYGRTFYAIAASESPFTLSRQIDTQTPTNRNSSQITFNGKTFHIVILSNDSSYTFDWTKPIISTPSVLRNATTDPYNATSSSRSNAYIMLYGDATESGGLPAQPGATVVAPGYVDTPEKAATYLPTVFPGMYADPVTWDTINPDTGETEQRRYLPIPFPNISNGLDPQPTSGTSTQQYPQVTPDADTQPTADTLAKILQEYLTDSTTPPPNPERTGEGTTPALVVPVGSASALWSVYHPTQAQLNQFGGWLWSSNFVDQLLKVFNNPMESLIGLHKIYAQPVDAGSSTIAVGYLNSNVPSATVTQQYVYVDCGSVSCLEEFGNVFDYPPYTTVKLYLPFVGIVPLDVAEVMRSTISVRYGVDVFTGACLAMVRVSRDGGGGVLYQYAGNCAVQYPLSSGSYMGIVSGILSVAGGVAATLATGGGAAPIALGVAGGAMAAHTSVQNSGSFAGNGGAMGGKIPYLVIQRPQSMMEYDYTGMRGAPANYTVQVRNCEGFIKAKSVKRLEAHATSAELEEIEQWLMEGVIV